MKAQWGKVKFHDIGYKFRYWLPLFGEHKYGLSGFTDRKLGGFSHVWILSQGCFFLFSKCLCMRLYWENLRVSTMNTMYFNMACTESLKNHCVMVIIHCNTQDCFFSLSFWVQDESMSFIVCLRETKLSLWHCLVPLLALTFTACGLWSLNPNLFLDKH